MIIAARTTAAISEEVVSLVQQSRTMVISWSRRGFPTGGIESYEFAISFELPTPAVMDMSAHAIPQPGVDVGTSWAVGSPVAAKVQIVTLKGDPQLPDEMWIRPKTLGALFGEAFGLVEWDGINPMCVLPRRRSSTRTHLWARKRTPLARAHIRTCACRSIPTNSICPFAHLRPTAEDRLDWRPDGQQYCAVYLGIGQPGLVCPQPGGSEYSYIPSTMSMWVR